MFQNREQAGWLLAERLVSYCDDPSGLILALPRGGVAVGYTLSLALRLPLEVLIARKLGAPGNPEFAIGAIAEIGEPFFNRPAVSSFHLSLEDLRESIEMERQEIARRQALYRNGRPLPHLAGRTVLLVDDGIATGSTFLVAVRALRGRGLKKLIAAVPVGPWETLRELEAEVDELAVLITPEPFHAVGNHYADFMQVGDAAVLHYLAEAAAARHGGPQDVAAERLSGR